MTTKRDGKRFGAADRASLSVEATLGWRAIWAAFKRTGRTERLFPSSRSVMPEEIVAGAR